MDQVLIDFHCAKCYIDNIIVFSSTMEEHGHHLQDMFEHLGAHGLKFHLGKCKHVFGPHDSSKSLGSPKGQGGWDFQGFDTN
jgi:hypothetical protein